MRMMKHSLNDIKKADAHIRFQKADCHLEGIRKERLLLSELKGRARSIYNTSNLIPRELREKIIAEFSSQRKIPFSH